MLIRDVPCQVSHFWNTKADKVPGDLKDLWCIGGTAAYGE